MGKENKEPIKIRLSTVILAFIILILIIVIVGLVYINFSKKTNNDNKTENINNIEEKNDSMQIENITNNQVSEKEKKLDINSEQIAKLYNYIPVANNEGVTNENDSTTDKTAYQSKKIQLEDLSTKYLLLSAFRQTTVKNSDKNQTKEGMSVNSGYYSFDGNILQNKAKEMYGKNIENKDFQITLSESCTYDKTNNKYLVSNGGGGATTYIYNIRELEDAIEKDDNIYIIDKYMQLECNAEKGTHILYNTSDNAKIIKEWNTSEWNKLSKNEYYADKTDIESIKNKYSSEMKKYKHTFKKNDQGIYYWYSTEPIN